MSVHGPPPSSLRSEYVLARALAEAGSADEAVQRLLEVVGRTFGWVLGELWLAEDDDGLLRYGGDWSLDGPEVAEFRALGRRLSFVQGVGLPGRVWATGDPVWVPDVTADPNFPRVEAATRAGLRTGVALPVFGGRRPLGVLEFFATEVRELDREQLELMLSAARQIGVYLARVQAEQRLRATEESSGSIFDAALDCIITMDAEGRVLDFNPAARATFGYEHDETKGRRLAELIIPEELRAVHERALRRYVATRRPTILNQRLELVAVRSDGTRFPVELTVTRLGTHEPPTFAGFVRDITRRREAEQQVAQLLEREQRARVEAEVAERSARRVSEVLQRSLLPPHLPSIRGIELAAAYEPAGQGSVVGGDFYDVFPVAEDRWGIVIGDVSGKGADAASLTALVRYTLRTAAVREHVPRTVLCIVNDALLRESRDNAYCTLVYAALNLIGGRPVMQLAIAGHPPPLAVRADGSAETIGSPGTLLGAVADPQFEDQDVILRDDETVLFYTDGVTETRTSGGLLGLHGLRSLVRRCPDRRPESLVACLASAVHRGIGHRVTDDIALLALRHRG